ncbi:MAG: superfamily protein [Gemmatimonadetes bacterium]|nr:superfamily protein [Gemmatimonadota bacterium]
MKQSESIASLCAALVKVHQTLEPIIKDANNPHFKKAYASLDAIMEYVRAPLAGEGLAIVQGGGAPISNVEGIVVGVAVETMLVHTSGEYMSSAITLPLDRPSPQAVGSAITYGRRYGVSALLALTTEEDDDGNVATASSLNAPALRTAATAALQTNAAKEPANAVARSAPATNGVNDPSCPICAGPMWDDRLGKKNPSAPDFKCKNKPKVKGGPGCEGVIWPPKVGIPQTAPSEFDDGWRPDDEPPF